MLDTVRIKYEYCTANYKLFHSLDQFRYDHPNKYYCLNKKYYFDGKQDLRLQFFVVILLRNSDDFNNFIFSS